MKYVLLETSMKRDRPLFYRQMTPIGPQSTADLAEAERFDSMDAANMSSAHRHWLTFWKVITLTMAKRMVKKAGK